MPTLPDRQAVLQDEIAEAREELARPAVGLVFSSIMAGMAVGLGPLLGLAVETLHDGSGALRPHVYALGFVLAVVARTDVFTEYTTIAILPVLYGIARLRALGRLWALVLVGNLIGAGLIAATVAALLPENDVLSAEAMQRVVRPMIAPRPLVMFVSASLAGWIMGLLSWLVVSSRETISQALFVYLAAFAIALAHMHHIVSGFTTVLMATIIDAGANVGDLAHFTLWTTLGNAFGGLVFALQVRFSIFKRHGAPNTRNRAPKGS